jgi:hypothetical protein
MESSGGNPLHFYQARANLQRMDREAKASTFISSMLDALYRPETLASDHARRVFVLPDASQREVLALAKS